MSDQPITPAPLPPADADAKAPDAATTQDHPPKTFTQEDVDRVVSDRLTRERGKFADYDDLKVKAAEYDKAQDAAKSAEQRAADEAARAQQSAREATERADRAELGVEHSIGKDFLDLLGGGSREDMASRAERLAPLLAAQRENEQLRAENESLRNGRSVPTRTPVASLRPGATPAQELSPEDALYASIYGKA